MLTNKLVSAVIWYGDPRRVPNKPNDKGSAQSSGVSQLTIVIESVQLTNGHQIHPRTESEQSCDGYASLTESFCDDGDPVCASGSDYRVHGHYKDKYDGAAFDFILSQI